MNEKKKVEHLGKNIKYVRENICHMTQRKFSESVNISVEQLQKIEQGNSLPSVPSLFAIAKYANVPIDLLSRDDIEPSKLYTIIYLMKEIKKYDSALIDNIGDMLLALHNEIQNGEL